MGVMVSKDTKEDSSLKRRSKVIDDELILEKKKNVGTMKLLLLGIFWNFIVIYLKKLFFSHF